MPGARNSTRDLNELRTAKKKAHEITDHLSNAGIPDDDEEEEQPAEEKAIIVSIDEVKALGDGKIGGYLVRFGSASEPDLVGDFFTPDTDFGDSETTNVLYHHGQDAAMKARSLGRGTLIKDDIGVWVEAQLKKSDEYEQQIYEMVKAGKLRWSSGTAPHLVERQQMGKAMWIKSWPLGLDASLTPMPAEPRNVALIIKSLETSDMEEQQHTTPAPDVEKEVKAHSEEPDVDKVTSLEESIKSLSEKNEALQSQVESILNAPPLKSGYGATQEPKPEEAYLKAFNFYVKTGDPRQLREVKAPMETRNPSEGGYLVHPQYSSEMTAAMKDASILRTAGARVINVANTNTFYAPTLSHSSAAVLTTEEATYDEQEPTVGQVRFEAYKYTRLSKVSEELLNDSSINIMSQILVPDWTQSFAAAENTVFTTGNGASQPEGIITGGTVTQTATDDTFAADDLIALYHAMPYFYRQRAVWLMNDAIIQSIRKLKEATTGNYLWQPGLQAGQPDRLLGLPVYTLNTMDDTVADGKNIAVLADMSYYWIVDFGEQTMTRLNELYAATGQVGFRAYRRFDAHVMLPEAIRVLQVQ